MAKDTFTLQLFGEVENLLRQRPDLFWLKPSCDALILDLPDHQVHVIIRIGTINPYRTVAPYQVEFFINGEECTEDLLGVPAGFSDAVRSCTDWILTQNTKQDKIKAVQHLRGVADSLKETK